jgi:hypothetical protein
VAASQGAVVRAAALAQPVPAAVHRQGRRHDDLGVADGVAPQCLGAPCDAPVEVQVRQGDRDDDLVTRGGEPLDEEVGRRLGGERLVGGDAAYPALRPALDQGGDLVRERPRLGLDIAARQPFPPHLPHPSAERRFAGGRRVDGHGDHRRLAV